MSADILDRLAAVDPAATMPEATEEEDERLVASIVAAEPPTRPLPLRKRHRRRWFALAAAGLLLVGGATAYGTQQIITPPPTPPRDDPGLTWQQFRDEYYRWTQKIELPAGVRWNRFVRPYDFANTHYGTNSGASWAIEQAIGRWAEEWIAAAKDRDQRRIAVADAWLVRLRATMRGHTKYMGENQSGYGQSTLDELDAAIAAARDYRFAPLAAFAKWARPPHWDQPPETYPGTEYPIGWSGRIPLDLSTAELNAMRIAASDAAAEYAATLRSLGLPQSAPWRDWPGAEALRTDALYDKGDGWRAAAEYAWTAWWREWVAAARAGDDARVAAAAAASARLHDLLAAGYPPDPDAEQWSGVDAHTLRTFEELDRRARRGDLQGIKDWLAYQEWYREQIRKAAE